MAPSARQLLTARFYARILLRVVVFICVIWLVWVIPAAAVRATFALMNRMGSVPGVLTELLTLSLAPLLGITVLVAFERRLIRWLVSPEPLRCPSCEYPLAALPPEGKCPECGLPLRD